MSVSRIIVFAIGAILAFVGLFLIINNLHDMYSLIVGAVLVLIGVALLSNKVITI